MGKPSKDTQNTQARLTQEQLDLAKKQEIRSEELYGLTEPGLRLTEQFYQTLASGDPKAIERATAPATERIAGQYEAAKKNIATTTPRGGTRELAMEEADISKAGQIGGTEAQAYLGSFPALANLAQGGVGLSINEVAQALTAFSGASSSNVALGQMQGAGKASTMGFLGSLTDTASKIAAAVALG